MQFKDEDKIHVTTTALQSKDHISSNNSELAKDGLNDDQDKSGMNAWLEDQKIVTEN